MDEVATTARVSARGAGEEPLGLRANLALDLRTARAAFPGGAALLPLVALGIGLGFGIARPGYITIYSQSLLFIVLAVACGAFGRTTGAALVLSHAVGDMARFLQNRDGTVGAQVSRDTIIGRLIIEGVLWLVVVIVPTAARRLEVLVERPLVPRLPQRLAGSLSVGVGVAAGTYLWANVMPYLVRPAFVYSPPPDTLQPQLHPELLAVAAGCAAALVTLLLRRRRVAAAEIGPLIGGLPRTGFGALVVRAVGFALMLALLAGVLTSPADVAILVGAFVLGELGAAAAGRSRSAAARAPGGVIVITGLALSGAAALIGAWAVDRLGLAIKGEDPSFLPIVVAAGVGFVVARSILALADPGQGPRPWVPTAPGAPAMLSGLALAVVLGGLVLVPTALADNCSNLGDCGFSQHFLLVISGFAAFFGAGAAAMSGGGTGGAGGDGGAGGGSRGGKSTPGPKGPPPSEPPPDEVY
jgi:hypothetical protein